MTGTVWPIVRKAIREMIASHPSDLIVSVHPLINGPLLRALGKDRPPFITIVTDLATTHAFWYHPQTDLCLVPTEEAYRRAIKWKVPMERVHITGLPVSDRFCQPITDRDALRGQLGWPHDLPMTVLVGGGDGLGPLGLTAEAIAASGIRTGLAIVTGRNQKLKEQLEAHKWPYPTFIYGFVRNMPEFMGAADVLVTKAGPGTITEALNAGLPMILYSKLPGQEDGNVTFVTQEGAGIWAPKPDQIVASLENWVTDPEKRAQAALTCRRLARPQAAHKIASFLAGQVGLAA
jgi:1,2-diacylglycerol 3-beta-galactosyltransferase